MCAINTDNSQSKPSQDSSVAINTIASTPSVRPAEIPKKLNELPKKLQTIIQEYQVVAGMVDVTFIQLLESLNFTPADLELYVEDN